MSHEEDGLTFVERDDAPAALLSRDELRDLDARHREAQRARVERQAVGVGAVLAREGLELVDPVDASLRLEHGRVVLHGVGRVEAAHGAALAVLLLSEVPGAVRAREELQASGDDGRNDRGHIFGRLQDRSAVERRLEALAREQIFAGLQQVLRRDRREGERPALAHERRARGDRDVLEYHLEARVQLADLPERVVEPDLEVEHPDSGLGGRAVEEREHPALLHGAVHLVHLGREELADAVTGSGRTPLRVELPGHHARRTRLEDRRRLRVGRDVDHHQRLEVRVAVRHRLVVDAPPELERHRGVHDRVLRVRHRDRAPELARGVAKHDRQTVVLVTPEQLRRPRLTAVAVRPGLLGVVARVEVPVVRLPQAPGETLFQHFSHEASLSQMWMLWSARKARSPASFWYRCPAMPSSAAARTFFGTSSTKSARKRAQFALSSASRKIA